MPGKMVLQLGGKVLGLTDLDYPSLPIVARMLAFLQDLINAWFRRGVFPDRFNGQIIFSGPVILQVAMIIDILTQIREPPL